MAKEITEIDNSSSSNKQVIAQIRKKDRGLVDFNNSIFLMPSTRINEIT